MKDIRLLVVDDEENIRILFKEELEDEGYIVDVAASGEEAIEKIKENHFDLIILDIKMPGMDGITVLNKIKNMNKEQPVVLCSAYGELRQDFSSWVSDAYVVKSADLHELKETIKNLLHLQ
jgi:CheY-like chemotaxis protein